MSTRIRWEYKVVEREVGRYYDSLYELLLQTNGNAGWELVHITERKIHGDRDNVSLKAYLKRPIVD